MAQAVDPVASGTGATAGSPSTQAKSADAGAKNDGAAAGQPESAEERLRKAEGIVRRNVYWALGVGIVPFPIVDFVGLTAVELKLIKELSDCYGVKFTENTAKSIIGSLAVSIGSLGLAEAVAGSLLKLIPAVGTVVGVVGVSVIAGAFTQALGNAFIMHFETGGTLLDFNPDKMRAYFRQEMEKAKASVVQMQKEKQGAGQAKPVA